MFDRIASVYDVMNGAMTAGLHHRWRERAADLARVGPGGRALDLATGTGDLAFALARRVWPDGEVVGADFAEGMLDRARAKAAGLGADARARAAASPSADAEAAGGAHSVCPRFEWADAMSLPYADGSFDAATSGFGVRNFEDRRRGLAEMVRVVRPGGRVVVLEITTPTRAPLSYFYRLWFDRIVPVLGRATGALTAARAPSAGAGATIARAYTYLPSSVRRFPAPAALAAEMERAGLVEIHYVLMAGGIVAIHAGTVGPERA